MRIAISQGMVQGIVRNWSRILRTLYYATMSQKHGAHWGMKSYEETEC